MKITSVFSELLQCGFCGLHVFNDTTIIIYIPKDHCTSMHGAICFAQNANKHVKDILVISGGKPDIKYSFGSHGIPEWKAFYFDSDYPSMDKELTKIEEKRANELH